MPAHPAQDFCLLTPTPEDILPSAEPDKGQEYFFNFGYQGEINTPKKTSDKLLLCRHIVLGGSIILSFTPHHHPSLYGMH